MFKTDLDDDELIATRDGGKCEYCEGEKILKSCNFAGSAKLRVLGDILDIWGDENKFNLFKRTYRPRFAIKYCPMCGRKLK